MDIDNIGDALVMLDYVERVTCTGSVLETIRGLADEGMTMVVVTHEIGFARDVADRVIYLDEGVVAEEGPSSIIDDPKTERMRRFLSSIND